MWKQVYEVIVKIAQAAGNKAPLIWPDLLLIGAALRRIAVVLGAETIYGSRDSSIEEPALLVQIARDHGLPEAEAFELAGIANLSSREPSEEKAEE